MSSNLNDVSIEILYKKTTRIVIPAFVFQKCFIKNMRMKTYLLSLKPDQAKFLFTKWFKFKICHVDRNNAHCTLCDSVLCSVMKFEMYSVLCVGCVQYAGDYIVCSLHINSSLILKTGLTFKCRDALSLDFTAQTHLCFSVAPYIYILAL